MSRSVIGLALLALAGMAWDGGLPANAQGYPSKTVTIVVPVSAGTSMDTIARVYAERLSQRLGKPVIVENKPGASTTLGASAVAAAAPDGHTLLVATSGAMAIQPSLAKKLSYDAEKDFVPIALYAKSPFILVINPALPIRSIAELIAYAKTSSKPLAFSSAGPGTPQHLSMEFTVQHFGLTMTHVPYRNLSQSVLDIAAGHVSLGFAEAGVTLPLVREGKVRALAVSSATRLPLLPDVPPLAEAANTPGFEAVSWHALFAPAKTPPEVVARLHEEMKQIGAMPEMKQREAGVGLIPVDTASVEDVRVYIRAEREKWGTLVRNLGLAGSN